MPWPTGALCCLPSASLRPLESTNDRRMADVIVVRSRKLLPSSRTIRAASRAWCAASFGLGPNFTPRFLAAARPPFARARMRARSSSARDERNAKMPRPIGVVRSSHLRSSALKVVEYLMAVQLERLASALVSSPGRHELSAPQSFSRPSQAFLRQFPEVRYVHRGSGPAPRRVCAALPSDDHVPSSPVSSAGRSHPGAAPRQLSGQLPTN